MAVLRKAQEGDMPQMEALITNERLPTYGLRDYLETFFVMEDRGRIVGCAGLELYGEAALLRSVVVAPGRRRQDEGGRLVEAALAEAKERGVTTVYLFTMNAGPFFRLKGFREMEPEDFEDSVRASMQYEAVTQMPELRRQIKGMVLELAAE